MYLFVNSKFLRPLLSFLISIRVIKTRNEFDGLSSEAYETISYNILPVIIHMVVCWAVINGPWNIPFFFLAAAVTFLTAGCVLGIALNRYLELIFIFMKRETTNIISERSPKSDKRKETEELSSFQTHAFMVYTLLADAGVMLLCHVE
jgi:hypothetical protein